MTEPSESHPEPVVFKVASSPFEARLIAAILRDAGVSVFIEGESLTDEFALSQRLMNLQGVSLKVPGDQIEQATAALAAAKEAGESFSEDDAGDADTGDADAGDADAGDADTGEARPGS